MVYPPYCQNSYEREMYKKAIKDEWNKDQLQRFHGLSSIPPKSGCSSVSGICTSHKAKALLECSEQIVKDTKA